MTSEKVFLTDQSNIRFLLITANTGTIFEKPELLSVWVTEFANLLRRHPSDFIALHCQEVGGKDYERYMHILDTFIKDILQIPEIITEFSHYRVYFDSDYTSQDTFTALGSSYFIRQNIPIKQWNFTTSSFQNVTNRQIFTGNLLNVQTLRKEKFPREFFPEAKWSRKGFTQTRWSINSFVFDMVNVHLFHDASNLLAVEKSPSVYSAFRKNALEHTLRRLPLNPSDAPVPYAIFGDFNFRLDALRLVQNIAKQRNGLIDKIKPPNDDEIIKIIIKNSQNKSELTVEKKGFNLHADHDSFFSSELQQFHMFDFETSSFTDQLFEFEKTFPPSYPFSEEYDEPRSYLRVRCPAWCDRILLSHSFKNFLPTENHRPTYNVLGKDVCMGDHKPVYLAFTTQLVQGWSTSMSSLPNSVFPSSSPFSLTCDGRVAPTNHNNTNQEESPVTVMSKFDSNLTTDFILNEIQLPSDDISLFNVHDYAIFIQPSVLPPWWVEKFQAPQMKTTNLIHSSSVLWAKVRAVTYMTTLAHRTGSWYSDDPTEKSPLDDISSLSDEDENPNLTNFELNDFQDYTRNDLTVPLRRSFSTCDYGKHIEAYSPGFTRSRSTTLINSSEQVADSSAVELASPPSSSPSVLQSSSRVFRFLHCSANDNGRRMKNLPNRNSTSRVNSSKLMNENISEVDLSITTKTLLKLEYEKLNPKKVTLVTATTTPNDNHRTVLARHIFHADIKQTLTRWIRETPV